MATRLLANSAAARASPLQLSPLTVHVTGLVLQSAGATTGAGAAEQVDAPRVQVPDWQV
uniref:hypothetical protein n=1 Tax=Ramlibacter montanisoli TaxID=2732512 RepID=UPI0035A0BBF9